MDADLQEVLSRMERLANDVQLAKDEIVSKIAEIDQLRADLELVHDDAWRDQYPRFTGGDGDDGAGFGIVYLASTVVDMGTMPAGTNSVVYNVLDESVAWSVLVAPEPSFAGNAQDPNNLLFDVALVSWPLMLLRAG